MNKICLFFLIIAISTLKAQETKIEVFNTSINSSYAELGVTYLDENTILFASSKKMDDDKNFSNKRRRNNSQLHLELYLGTLTNDGDIIQTAKFSKNKNNPVLESDISFSPDRKTVFFTWNNYSNTLARKDSAKWKTLHIVKAAINENLEISDIKTLPFNHKKYDVRSPEVSKDGKQLFFTSNMEGGYGEYDIYVVDILANDTYSEPRNLGSKVNTSESEFFPFVDQNNNLYFSSYGHKGLGSLDIFKSDFKDGAYQKPIALKAPINSEYDDFGYVENQLGNAGFFTSNRKESRGDVDIFSVKYIEKECLSNLIVNVFHNESQLELANVPVSIYENNTLIKSAVINPNSTQNISLKCNTSYKISIEHEGFYANEIEFTTPKTAETISKQLFLTPLECFQTISGIVKNSKDNLTELNTTIQLYANNTLIKTQVANEEGFHFKINCNETYKIIATKEGFESNELDFSSDKIIGKNNPLTINLTPIECNQTITGIVLNKETNEPVLNAKVSLLLDNQLIESTFTGVSNKFSFPIQCETNYKIMVENEQFISSEELFSSDATLHKNNDLTIYLTPIICTQTITGIVLNKETNEPVLNAKVSLYSNNKFVESQFTANGRGYNFTIDCNSDNKITVSQQKFKSAENLFKTNSTNKSLITKNLLLEPVIEFITQGEQKAIKTNAIYFDLDSHEIRPDATIELNKVIGVLKKYPTLKIEVQSHTDSRAPDNYNLSLSERRANSSMNYIISQGIDPERLIGKGYGETKLKNKCANGVPCSNAEHESNRRTEFVIIEEK